MELAQIGLYRFCNIVICWDRVIRMMEFSSVLLNMEMFKTFGFPVGSGNNWPTRIMSYKSTWTCIYPLVHIPIWFFQPFRTLITSTTLLKRIQNWPHQPIHDHPNLSSCALVIIVCNQLTQDVSRPKATPSNPMRDMYFFWWATCVFGGHSPCALPTAPGKVFVFEGVWLIDLSLSKQIGGMNNTICHDVGTGFDCLELVFPRVVPDIIMDPNCCVTSGHVAGTICLPTRRCVLGVSYYSNFLRRVQNLGVPVFARICFPPNHQGLYHFLFVDSTVALPRIPAYFRLLTLLTSFSGLCHIMRCSWLIPTGYPHSDLLQQDKNDGFVALSLVCEYFLSIWVLLLYLPTAHPM